MRWRNTLTILVLLTVTSLPGFAQWRWGRPNRPQSGACFYRDTNFRGDYFCLREGQRWDSLPPGYNDKISSINIYGGARLRLFNDQNFSGESVLIDSDVRDLRWIPLPGNIFKQPPWSRI